MLTAAPPSGPAAQPLAQIRALGPLTVIDRTGTSVPIPPKPRVLLALLVTHTDRAVSTSSMIQELWGEAPPRSAQATLQTYIGQLRRGLAEATGLALRDVVDEVLVTEGAGYRLSSDRLALDIADYGRLDRTGRGLVRSGDYALGASMLREALALWRGPALVNVGSGLLLASQIARLEEEQLATREHRLVADLHLGEHHAVVGELTELVARHPLNESLHGHLMLALYRCGRRAEALATMRHLRSQLVVELGLEPTSDLVRLHEAILKGDSSLNLARTAGDGDGRRLFAS